MFGNIATPRICTYFTESADSTTLRSGERTLGSDGGTFGGGS